MRMLSKIISGGQTGADRAALDCAIAHGMAHGGAIPAGRKAEDGPLPARYEMRELSSPHYQERTAQNVNDGDGTLIVSHGALSGGSAFTRTVAQRLGKPMLHLDLASIDIETARYQLIGWLWVNKITILNVAGPRASSDPNIYHQTFSLLTAVLSMLTDDTGAGGNQVREGFLPSSASDERVVFLLISFWFKKSPPGYFTTPINFLACNSQCEKYAAKTPYIYPPASRAISLAWVCRTTFVCARRHPPCTAAVYPAASSQIEDFQATRPHCGFSNYSSG
jgi:hypothetical protein